MTEFFNFSWTIPFIPAETNHECLSSRLSSYRGYRAWAQPTVRDWSVTLQLLPFLKASKKPPLHCPLTVSLKWVQAGLIPCTESIDFSNNETKAISAPPPLVCSLSHTAGFTSSVSLQSDWDGAEEFKMVFCRFGASCSWGHFWFVIYLWRYRPHAQRSILSEILAPSLPRFFLSLSSSLFKPITLKE